VVTLPPSAPADGTLDYVVTITNTANSTFEWSSPCPTYDESVGPSPAASTSYTLNCVPAEPISAGGSIEFDIQMPIPSTASGPMRMVWVLDGTVTAGGQFTAT
jgi:hypothetical protein